MIRALSARLLKYNPSILGVFILGVLWDCSALASDAYTAFGSAVFTDVRGREVEFEDAVREYSRVEGKRTIFTPYSIDGKKGVNVTFYCKGAEFIWIVGPPSGSEVSMVGTYPADRADLESVKDCFYKLAKYLQEQDFTAKIIKRE